MAQSLKVAPIKSCCSGTYAQIHETQNLSLTSLTCRELNPMVISVNLNASSATAPSLEIQLLLCCARTQLDEARVDQLQRLLQQPLDWDRVVEAACLHRVIPLLYQTLNTHVPTLVPTETLEELHQKFQDNQFDNLALTQELLRLLKLLAEHQIPAIPFRGPVLATAIYQNLALRTFSDLDILVHPQHFLMARDLLLVNGYQSGMGQIYLLNSSVQEVKLMKALGKCPLQHTANLFRVDLHRRLVAGEFYNLSVNFDQIWYRLQTVSLLGTPVPSLHPEDLLLYLCVHGAKDRWQRLSWVCDVAEFVRLQTNLNWTELRSQAQWSGTEQMLLLGLVLARDLLGLPDARNERCQQPSDLNPSALKSRSSLAAIASTLENDFCGQSLAHQVQQQIFQSNNAVDLTANLWQRFIFGFQLLERFDDRCRCSLMLFKTLLRPTLGDRKFYPLPAWLHFLYPIVRAVRLLDSARRARKPDVDRVVRP
jgi:hypothetical protein